MLIARGKISQMFFEVPQKGEKSRFLLVYDWHKYFDIFEKNMFIPYSEYAESD